MHWLMHAFPLSNAGLGPGSSIRALEVILRSVTEVQGFNGAPAEADDLPSLSVSEVFGEEMHFGVS